tara:strand:- start:229 stop:960 length:732 start_codon:yes stop_codon:yes gene_type:complete
MASKLVNSQYLLDTGGSVEIQGAERKPVSDLIIGDIIIFQNQIIQILTIAESDEVRSDAVPTSWVGTTAGKLVELDSSARIPAVDGSLVTNVVHTEVDPSSLKISNNLSDLNSAGTARTNMKTVRSFSVQVVADGTNVTTSDTYYIYISSALDGLSLASFRAYFITAGAVGALAQVTIQKKNGGSWTDMLTSASTILATLNEGTAGAIDAEAAAVATGDVLKISVPVQGLSTPQGLLVNGTFN